MKRNSAEFLFVCYFFLLYKPALIKTLFVSLSALFACVSVRVSNRLGFFSTRFAPYPVRHRADSEAFRFCVKVK